MSSSWQDVRYALRGLRKQPAFAALAAVTLGLGIGSATTIFSVIQNVLLDPYPYIHIERNVAIEIRDLSRPQQGGRSFLKPAEFLEYQTQVQAFEDVIANGFEDILYTTADGTEQLNGGLMSGNTFAFLGIPAAMGRTLTPDDAKPGAPPVFVLSHRAWVRYFGGDSQVVGRTFVLNGIPTTLVGIMPPRFHKMASDVYKPLVLDPANPEQADRFFRFQARLKPGVTIEQAEAEMAVVARRVAALYPRDYPEKFTIKVLTWVDNIVGQFQTTLFVLAAAVGLLLLIACSNVANMLLTRGAGRQREMAVRASLGASRPRLVAQLLVESMILALFGAIVGCIASYFGLQLLVAAIPEGLIPREAIIRLNVPALAFSLAIAVATSIICGLVPALRTARKDLVEPLKDSGRGSSGGVRSRNLSRALVVVEVALSLILLTGAGLLMRSFVKLTTIDLGMNPNNVLVVRLPLPRGQYQTVESKRQFFSQVLARVQALPGVVSATETSTLPPFGGIGTDVEIAGKTHEERWQTLYQLCSEGYFQTLEIRLLRGRVLSASDVNAARRVAVITQAFADRYFGDDDPIGRQIRFPRMAAIPESPVANPVFDVIGVVATVKNQGVQEPPVPEAFVPYTITGAFERGLLVKTAGSPQALLESVKREIWSVDRHVALTNTGPLMDFLARFSYAGPRFTLVVLSVFAGVGLALVVLGVFSMIAYTVARQTHEIGLRMALGASRPAVLRMVLSLGVRLTGAGILLGVAASLALTRVLTSQLFGVTPNDPATLVGVAALVAVAALSACYFPARRATRVDPMEALRYE